MGVSLCHNFQSIEHEYAVADTFHVSVEISTFLASSVDSPRDNDGFDGHGETLDSLTF